MMKIFVSVAIRDGDRVLLVQEGKPGNYGKWNLPGGHLELGETLQQGALREVREETLLDVELSGLLGTYTLIRRESAGIAWQAVRFVFAAPFAGGEAQPGDDILTVRWFTLAEMAQLQESEWLSPTTMADVLLRLQQDEQHSLALLKEPV
ncbi:MAG: NUDIX domain-containing protein [Acidobacteria bacterium]|nr:NUDIX domain-containing protein [Acidobacteriota bacterium]